GRHGEVTPLPRPRGAARGDAGRSNMSAPIDEHDLDAADRAFLSAWQISPPPPALAEAVCARVAPARSRRSARLAAAAAILLVAGAALYARAGRGVVKGRIDNAARHTFAIGGRGLGV